MPGTDFEDNIHIAAAVVAPLDAIVSRNVADFTHAPSGLGARGPP